MWASILGFPYFEKLPFGTVQGTVDGGNLAPPEVLQVLQVLQ